MPTPVLEQNYVSTRPNRAPSASEWVRCLVPLNPPLIVLHSCNRACRHNPAPPPTRGSAPKERQNHLIPFHFVPPQSVNQYIQPPPSSERSREAELPGHEVPRRSPNSPIRRSPPVALLWHPQSHGLAANPTLATDRQALLLPPFQSLATRVPTLESEAVTEKQSSPECRIVPRDFVKTTGAPLVRRRHLTWTARGSRIGPT